jgi:endonuclease/exonuclease/phosphatase family metal-dependent hydrolase
MSINYKKLFRKTVFILGSLYSLVYLLSCLTPYISPVHFYPFTFLALMFPCLLGGMLVWLIIALILYKKKGLWYLFVIGLGFQNIHAVFAFRTSKEFVHQKDKKSFRVLSWNVEDFLDSQYHTDTVGNKRRDMMAFIKQMDADIVCIQDFTEQTSSAFRSCIKDVIETNNYPYHFFSRDFEMKYYYAFSQYGTCIFSKYPIVDSGRVTYAKKNYPESLAFADLRIGADTVRVYNTHLQSMYLKFTRVPGIQYDFLKDEMPFLEAHPKVQDRLRHFDKKHVEELAVAKPFMNASKHPYIFCADLNSVPSSYVYQKISKGLTDAFTAKGSGLGATYDGISPTLRIDVVLMSKQLKPVQYYSPRLHASDHFPIVTDIQFR